MKIQPLDPQAGQFLSHSKDKKVILPLYHHSILLLSMAVHHWPGILPQNIFESMLIHCSSHNMTLGHAGQVALVHRAHRRNVKGASGFVH